MLYGACRVWPEACLPYTSGGGDLPTCPAKAPCQGQVTATHFPCLILLTFSVCPSIVPFFSITFFSLQEVFMQPAYRVGRAATATQPRRTEEDIMQEVSRHITWPHLASPHLTSPHPLTPPAQVRSQGPVLALMEVYTDFFMYGSGVYRWLPPLHQHPGVQEDQPGQGHRRRLPRRQDTRLGEGTYSPLSLVTF